MKIGIYGGSFNPIHFGHLIPVSFVAEEAELDIVYFVVAKTPPHKDADSLIEDYHRLEMVRLALSENPRFEASDIELKEGQKPYTVDLLATMREKFPDDRLVLLIGADSLFDLKTWYNWELLFERADEIIAMARKGFPIERIDKELLSRVQFIETPIIELSSSMIREMIQSSKDIRYLLPSNVERYILEHGLFLHKNA